MNRTLALLALSLAACAAEPPSERSEQEFLVRNPDPTPTVCGTDTPCDDPPCADLDYACTFYTEYPDGAGCLVTAYDESTSGQPVIHCVCIGVLSRDTACVLDSFSS